MPELPEVETIRRELDREVVGRRIKTVELSSTARRTIRRHKGPKEFQSGLEGAKVTGVHRKGKYLLFSLDGAGKAKTLVVHLGMSGQLLLVKRTKEPRDRHTKVVVTFTQGGQLRFVDPRTFGEMFVTTPEDVDKQVPELAHLGFDPIEDIMSWLRLSALLQQKKTRLKTLLMDQRFVAGIGNIYADEILFAAGLRFDRESTSLTSQEVRRLHRSMVEVLSDAVKARGSSLQDEQYRDIFGETGDYQSRHNVYGRDGEPCRRCRSVIVRVKSNGRSTYLCEQCQV